MSFGYNYPAIDYSSAMIFIGRFYRAKEAFRKKLLLLTFTVIGSTFGYSQSNLELLRNRVLEDKLSGSVSEMEVRTMLNTQSPEGYWPAIDYNDVSRIGFEHRVHVVNIEVMSRAYRLEKSPLKGLPALKAGIDAAIDYWLAHDFIADNWHTNEIANPTSWIAILYLMDGELSNERVSGISALASRANLRAWGARPGGDLIKIAGLSAELALFHRDSSGVRTAVDAMVAEVSITSGMGIKPDLGFHHRSDRVTSILAYGTGYAATFADWGVRLSGTDFMFPEASTRLLVDYYLDGICKSMVHASFKDPGVINRGMSREGTLAPIGPELPAKLLSFTDYRKEELQNVVAIRTGVQVPNLSHNRFFWHSEYFSHQRPGFFASVRMHSERNHTMEAPHNQESLKMHHYADGSNFISRTGDEYFDIFPVWDWQKIPGTTVVQKPELPHWNQIAKPGKSTFVGAVTDGLYGASVFDFQSTHDPLRAKKAWFFFDDSYICLGSAIFSDADYPVATTINQTLSRSMVQVGSASGMQQLAAGIREFEAISWVVQDSVGYLFYEPTTAYVLNDTRTGYWQSIANSQRIQRKPAVSKDIFALWIDHGMKPQGAGYAYSVHPHVAAADMERIGTDSQVEVLANTSQVQAVWHKGLEMAQVVFYEPGRIELPSGVWISLSMPGVVLTKMDGKVISEVSVADPSRSEKACTLEFGGSFVGYGPFWKASAAGTSSTLQVLLPAGDQAGKSVTVKNHTASGTVPSFDEVMVSGSEKQPVQVRGERYIGEHFGGGVVVWLDETGSHGLVAPLKDQKIYSPWRNGRALQPQLYGDHGDRLVNAVGDGIYAGRDNSLLIIAQQTADNLSGDFAAKVCAACQEGGYGDWYLPSKAELDILFRSMDFLDGFEGEIYWSSSEYNIGFVWGQNFRGYGGSYPLNKGSNYAVRCIRKF
ncbi:MAG: chondroitin lyase [Lunatimonas sp.]|uniref:polysaccharide lyase family 8 super-sandwich domain-containing protein n=1 Tax=Lunatimonas sp. TaxID=2060141 RepID=UPI00263AF3BC|nr:polysaccharide lyase family 8 super-sandwich domain-containing protein [Lunatimonas sp.]MCC5935872.1 chondroitin lyase [Lunatimonas sp.]